MGGPGRGSGLEAEQAGVGPGAGSPSDPTVLRDVELPEPRGEAMAGVVEDAGGVEQEVKGSPQLSVCFQPVHSPTPGQCLSHGSPLSPLCCLGPVLSSPTRVLSGVLASTSLIYLHVSPWENFISLPI